VDVLLANASILRRQNLRLRMTRALASLSRHSAQDDNPSYGAVRPMVGPLFGFRNKYFCQLDFAGVRG
jgi:hypothetical protein